MSAVLMINHPFYLDDVNYVASLPLPWEKLENKNFLISGASGLMGTFLIDVLMYRNEKHGMGCKVYAISRNRAKAESKFARYLGSPNFEIAVCDINDSVEIPEVGDVHYVLHMASNTHPVAYSTDPIGTITANVIGTNNLLDFAVKHNAERFAFVSSNEIYGENRGDSEFFDEKYCGYIDSNTLRAGYPESKRCGETLCQAYRKQKGLDIVIPRFTRSFGPTMLMTDTKAVSQFIRKAVAGEDIVLKSEGNQYYSYTYVCDAVSGLLTVILKGECGEAYNIADESCDIRLKDLAAVLAEKAGVKVVFELPDAVEKAGYSTATKARLDGSKIKALGWRPRYDIRSGMDRTVDMLKYSLAEKKNV